jgi:uncharacterized membrane protein YraQ (UPF0718 family)
MEIPMLTELLGIAQLVVASFSRIWPYLLITIPLAVAVQMSGAAQQIRRVFDARPVAAIILATLVGAFSPFCSCGVIPLIASLLIGGVPLAPVMSFWIASPSMDPEIFFLSVATLGWELAVWRLLSTLLLSLIAGFMTHAVVARGCIPGSVLRSSSRSTWTFFSLAKDLVHRTHRVLVRVFSPFSQPALCCVVGPAARLADSSVVPTSTAKTTNGNCSDTCATSHHRADPAPSAATDHGSFFPRLLRESRAASLMVAKFMLIAVVLEALLTRYVAQEWIVAVLGSDNHFAILIAALVGVPVYTSNLTALPMVGALLTQGMSASAALAFLISGPTTTIPAMAAVWGLVRRRVFALYVSFALVGAIVLAALHHVVSGL